ncbi:MAG: CvpA family protein [Ruminococcus sp.]|jgi:uncharacterized membrane protein required for colicin V production|nr:CvpA family protein [Ruminococcus sp.]
MLVDIAALLILVLCLVWGYKNGLVRSLLAIILTAAAVMLATWLSDITSVLVYDKLIEPEITKTMVNLTSEYRQTSEYQGILDGLNDENSELTDNETEFDAISSSDNKSLQNKDLTNSEISGTLDSVINNMSTGFASYISEKTGISTADTSWYSDVYTLDNTEKLEFLANPLEHLSEIFTKEIIKPVLTRLSASILFFVFLTLIWVVFSIILKTTGVINKLPLIGTANKILGALLGLFFAAIIIYVMIMLMDLIFTFTGDNSLFDGSFSADYFLNN